MTWNYEKAGGRYPFRFIASSLPLAEVARIDKEITLSFGSAGDRWSTCGMFGYAFSMEEDAVMFKLMIT